jgi:hypothetical protein
MLLKYEEANAFDSRGAHNGAGGASPNGAGGLRPPAPFGEFIMCCANIESIGLRTTSMHWPPIFLKALTIHIL